MQKNTLATDVVRIAKRREKFWFLVLLFTILLFIFKTRRNT